MKKLLIVCLLLTGCCSQHLTPEEKQARQQAAWNSKWSPELPPGATEITDIGNDWVTFRWNNRKYLYQWRGSHGGHTVMVELREE